MAWILLLLVQASGENTLERIEREVSGVVSRVRPLVVQVQADGLRFSGILWDRQGHVVTAHSGVEGARSCAVEGTAARGPARLLGADRRTGVAVLKAEALEGAGESRLDPAAAKEGGTALVVGNALGMRGSAAVGSVAGRDCSILVGGRKVENLLQVHLRVQPGDAGAFLADAGGRLLGMLHSAGPETGEAFAVPADWVRFSADRIIRHGRMVRGWIGASLLPPGETLRAALGLPPGYGAEVVRVERDSPARRAGLETRDILLEFDGAPVDDLPGLQWKVASVERPSVVKISYLRRRERREADLVVEIDPR
jgi:S1-C subfamily serine protease